MVKKTKKTYKSVTLKPTLNKLITKNRKTSACSSKVTRGGGQSGFKRPSLRKKKTRSMQMTKSYCPMEIELRSPSAFQIAMASIKRNKNKKDKLDKKKVNKMVESLSKLLR